MPKHGSAGDAKQHTDFHRKVQLRRSLIDVLLLRMKASGSGGGGGSKLEGETAYIPFLGDGDLTMAIYEELGLKIWGADIDEVRVQRASSRLEEKRGEEKDGGWQCKVADLDEGFPFKREVAEGKWGEGIRLADFDAYSYPYGVFRDTWEAAPFASPCVLFFTDAQRLALGRAWTYRTPTGEKIDLGAKERGTGKRDNRERRTHVLNYMARTVEPWLREFMDEQGWSIVRFMTYRRGAEDEWGVVIE